MGEIFDNHNMITFLTLYLIVQTICVIWFYSPFRISLGQIIFDKTINDIEKFELILLIRSPFFGKLLSCYICFSFWTSLIVGLGATVILGQPIWFPLLCGLTYPSLCYLYKSIVERCE